MALSHPIQTELPADSDYPRPVPWMHSSFGFYALPGEFRLSQSPCYKQGRVYGQDVSSGAAVAALLTTHCDCDRVQQNNSQRSPLRVLDMCCAPGLKLCAIADCLRQNKSIGNAEEEDVVIGVDCSEARLSVCRNIIEKHQIDPYVGRKGDVRIRLYNNDGTTFGSEPTHLIFDSTVTLEQRIHGRKRRNKSLKGRERKRLKEVANIDHQVKQNIETTQDDTSPIMLFDRVLVDAECSTDGSLKHVQRLLAKESGIFVRTPSSNTSSKTLSIPVLTNEEELRQLIELQQSLVSTGFRLLKKGGQLVYSTCSLSEDQNEGVVKWLLNEYPSQASVLALSFDRIWRSAGEKPQQDGIIKEGSVPGTVRFVPQVVDEKDGSRQTLSGSGFFLAKIEKK